MHRTKTPLTLRRERLDLTQEQMAVLCGTVQSEISKTEATGEIEPDDLKRWAKHYGWSVRKFRNECDKLHWVLPLWRFAVRTPAEIEHIKCAGATVISGQTEGRLASIYTEAPLIGENEQRRRAM